MAVAKETRDTDLETKVYEVSFITPASKGEEGAAELFERVKKQISAFGTFIAEGAPQRMPLATEMARSTSGKKERHNEGFFSWIKFEATSEDITKLEDAMKKDVAVLRYLLIKTVRESSVAPRFLSSDRLEGETIRKREVVEKAAGPVSEEELDKSIQELVGEKS